MKSFLTYLHNVRAEMAHVVWPTQKQAISHVVLILVISAFTAVFIGVLDYVFTTGVSHFVS